MRRMSEEEALKIAERAALLIWKLVRDGDDELANIVLVGAKTQIGGRR